METRKYIILLLCKRNLYEGVPQSELGVEVSLQKIIRFKNNNKALLQQIHLLYESDIID